ncbi:hypothetical protein AQ490_26675 [Wenjunlia vitaminophila]|uniref:Transcriptional regulator n=1 Tax=Wenjunlia vitaminophila TaxID=76728 RepID=A0A0T6LQQ6_WENVI|nr:hypothetical protein [Wenjunlia vitaminophila]KRV48124.1 hypothetical protein AQ490_26675 [Wenjunlia vitaminophila]
MTSNGVDGPGEFAAAEGNPLLVAAMHQAGLSNKGLAQRIRRLGAQRGLDLKCTHTTVKRWRSGSPTRAVPPEIIAEVLTMASGQVLSPSDIGMASSGHSIDPHIGMEGPTLPIAAVHAAAVLWGTEHDLNSPRLPPVPAASLAGPVLRWLVASPSAPPKAHGHGPRVGAADVARVRAATSVHAALSNRFGGGATRTAALNFLRTEMLPLLHGRYGTAVGRPLFAAAATAALRTGHMSYDIGHHGLARRHLLLAVTLAHHADDRPLAARSLGVLAHQAVFLGDYREALDIVHAALQRAGSVATPAGRATLYAMEARAHAALGDVRATNTALTQAERHFEAIRHGEEPEWLGFFDTAELADEFGHCLVALGRGREARRYAGTALACRPQKYARSAVFTRLTLANAYLLDREVERACEVALQALPAVIDIQSMRVRAYLRDFRVRLRPYQKLPAVRSLEHRVANALTREVN